MQNGRVIDAHDDAQGLLSVLFGSLTSGHVTVWEKTQRGGVSHWYDLSKSGIIAQAAAKAMELAARGADVYFSTCPGRTAGGPKQRITQTCVACIPALFADLDVGKPGCPSTLTELTNALSTLSCPPSVVVGSGGGAHAYWLLDKPIFTPDKNALGEGKALLRRFADGIAMELGFSGFDTSASEPARVLRVPGTQNHKTVPPRPVGALSWSDRRYSLDELCPHMAAQKVPSDAPGTSHPQTCAGARLTLTDAELIAKAKAGRDGERFSSLWAGFWEGSYHSQSEADLALCNMLAFWTGGDAARIDDLFRQSGLMRPKWDCRHGPDTYGTLTVGRAVRDTHTFYLPKRLPAPSPAAAEAEGPFSRFERAYAQVGGYSASGGSLCTEVIDRKGNLTRRTLADFVALVDEVVSRDDGAEIKTEFVVSGLSSMGEEFPAATVPSSRFSGMSWPLECWGMSANLHPGQSVKDSTRYALQAASKPRQRTIYTHVGWRRVNGRPAYLHGGGAIGADGVCVDLDGALKLYTLPDRVDDLTAAALSSRRLLDVLPARVCVPLLAQVYLAPLCDFLEQASCPPSFVLYLSGASGSRKTTAAALGLSHYGAGFNAKRVPASFSDTSNAVREKAFALKDALLLIDDYAPSMNPQEQRRKAGEAQNLIRAYGDHAERGRMRADGTLQAPRPPRGLAIMTGEQLPDAGQSATARLFVVDVKPGEIRADEKLTEAQEHAASGVLAQALRGYVEWLLLHADELPDKLKAMFREYRGLAQQDLLGGHGRSPEAVAHLLIGWRMALDFWRYAGALDDPSALWTTAQRVFTEHAQAQGQTVREQDPVAMFFGALNEVIARRTAHLVSLSGADSLFGGDDVIGYQDAEYVYLLPGAAYGAVFEHFRAQGACFPISSGTLWKRMAQLEIVKNWPGRGQTRTKRVPGGASVSMVWIPRERADELLGAEVIEL